MHHCIPGFHLAVPKRAGKLELRCELVEYRRHDCDLVAGDGISVLLYLGASKGERKNGV